MTNEATTRTLIPRYHLPFRDIYLHLEPCPPKSTITSDTTYFNCGTEATQRHSYDCCDYNDVLLAQKRFESILLPAGLFLIL
ncbi:unnamed protein product [Absidia cylindrospora]